MELVDGRPVFDVEFTGPDLHNIGFTCPQCGTRNLHGSGDDPLGSVSHRGSHCLCWEKGGYYIRLPKER